MSNQITGFELKEKLNQGSAIIYKCVKLGRGLFPHESIEPIVPSVSYMTFEVLIAYNKRPEYQVCFYDSQSLSHYLFGESFSSFNEAMAMFNFMAGVN